MWSEGAADAWFSIDLVSLEILPTHFGYRGDYGGGGNHPKTFELQGSNDGSTWKTLSVHNNESWSGNEAKSWPIPDGEDYFHILRILNKGHPNHLCCSGIEFYGHTREIEPEVTGDAEKEGTWASYDNIDMCGQGDIEIIGDWRNNTTIEALKEICEKKGYSAMAVGEFGHAALKKFDYQLTKEHCKPTDYSCTIWIYTRPGAPKEAPKPKKGTSKKENKHSLETIASNPSGFCCTLSGHNDRPEMNGRYFYDGEENGKPRYSMKNSHLKLFWTGHSWDCFCNAYSPEAPHDTHVPPFDGYTRDQGSCDIHVVYESVADYEKVCEIEEYVYNSEWSGGKPCKGDESYDSNPWGFYKNKTFVTLRDGCNGTWEVRSDKKESREYIVRMDWAGD